MINFIFGKIFKQYLLINIIYNLKYFCCYKNPKIIYQDKYYSFLGKRVILLSLTNLKEDNETFLFDDSSIAISNGLKKLKIEYVFKINPKISKNKIEYDFKYVKLTDISPFGLIFNSYVILINFLEFFLEIINFNFFKKKILVS